MKNAAFRKVVKNRVLKLWLQSKTPTRESKFINTT